MGAETAGVTGHFPPMLPGEDATSKVATFAL